MKILLGTLNSKFVHTNLALRYLKAAIKTDAEVEKKEFTINEDQDNILYEIMKEGYQIVAFSCYIWNIEKTLNLAENIKKLSPKAIIILGGPEVSYEVETIMNKYTFIDYIISGEGEIPLKKLIIALKEENNPQSSSLEKIDGLSYRLQEKIYSNPYKLIEHLEDIPTAYETIKLNEIENKIIYYETSRGCGYNCAYCLSSVDKGIRAFPMEVVKKELKKLVDLGAKQIKFVDRTFNYNKNRTIELINYLKSIDNGKINFHFEITAFILNREISEILKTARPELFQLEIGIQSTNPKTLEIVGRANKLEEIKKWTKEIKSKNNIHIHLDLIAGLPEENLESFKKSFNETFEMKPDMLQLGFLKVLKGAPIYKMVEKYHIEYKSTAPYEVLKTGSISYFELNELKNIEEVLESTYNKNRGKKTLDYLYEKYYNKDAYKMFEDIVITIKQKNIEKNKKHWEYIALHHLCDKHEERDFLKELLKFEYMQNTKGTNIQEITDYQSANMEKQIAYTILRETDVVKELKMEDLYFKELCKKVKWQGFFYDILLFIEKGKIVKKENLIFTNFNSYDRGRQIYTSSRRYI